VLYGTLPTFDSLQNGHIKYSVSFCCLTYSSIHEVSSGATLPVFRPIVHTSTFRFSFRRMIPTPSDERVCLPSRPRGSTQALAVVYRCEYTAKSPHLITQHAFSPSQSSIGRCPEAMSFSSFLRRDSLESVRSVIHNSDLHANLLGDEESDEEQPLKPFRRWVSTLRRRKKHQSTPSVTPRSERWMLDDFDDHSPLEPRPLHAKSGSVSSSIRFVAGVKSATVTLASTSIAPLSRRASKWRRTHNRSSILSGSGPRPSIDTQRSVLDEASKLRSRKRREKLEELIRTEESYVADLRALSNVRSLVADSVATLLTQCRPTSHCLAIITRIRLCGLRAHLPKRPSPRC
jgi:hypothetical protein